MLQSSHYFIFTPDNFDGFLDDPFFDEIEAEEDPFGTETKNRELCILPIIYFNCGRSNIIV